MALRIPYPEIVATTLLLSASIANFGFWTSWQAVSYAGTMVAIAATATVGVASLVLIRSGRWFFAIITASAAAILYFSLVDADAGEANEYLGIILSALLLPVILLAAVAALISTVCRPPLADDQ